MSNRVYAHARSFFGWCEEEGLVEQSPLLGMKRPGGTETPRERKLEDHEVVAVWKAAGELGAPFGPLHCGRALYGVHDANSVRARHVRP